VVEYENHIKRQALKAQIKEASMRVCAANKSLNADFETITLDGLTDV